MEDIVTSVNSLNDQVKNDMAAIPMQMDAIEETMSNLTDKQDIFLSPGNPIERRRSKRMSVSLKFLNIRHKKGKSKPKLKIISTDKIYCICRMTERENMLGCDFCSEWYHIECLDISPEQAEELTKQKWACLKCEDINKKTDAPKEDNGITGSDLTAAPPSTDTATVIPFKTTSLESKDEEMEASNAENAQEIIPNKHESSLNPVIAIKSDQLPSPLLPHSSNDIKKEELLPSPKSQIKPECQDEMKIENKTSDICYQIPEDSDCNYCKYEALGLDDLNIHMREAHGRYKRYSCKECGTFSLNEKTIIRHVEISH